MHDGHRKRLKQRFLSEGISSFEKHNILELVLFYGIPRKDTNETAHELLNRFGSLSAVFDAPIEELCKVQGITENVATLIKLFPAVNKEYQKDKQSECNMITSCTDAIKYFIAEFTGDTRERFLILILDIKNKILKCEEISEGTLSHADVNRRKVIEKVIAVNGVSVILAHNHPSGRAVPSNDDIVCTKGIISALHPVEVRVFDHIIVVNEEEYFSMASSDQYGHLFS